MLAHPTRDMGSYHMVILELHPEHGVRECFEYGALEYYAILLGHSSLRLEAAWPRSSADYCAMSAALARRSRLAKLLAGMLANAVAKSGSMAGNAVSSATRSEEQTSELQ